MTEIPLQDDAAHDPKLLHLSYSSINTYLECSRKWRFHYVDKIKTPTATSLLFGSVFHKTLENYYKMQHRTPDRYSLTEWWQMSWTQTVEQTPQIDWDVPQEQLYNDGVRILSNEPVVATLSALRPMVENGQPLLEKPVKLYVPDVPIPVIGYIDMIEQDGVPIDFKTASRSWWHKKAQQEMQPVFYLAALNQAGYEPVLKFRHYVFVKNKTPKVEIWETTRTVQDMLWLYELIQEVWQAIEKGVFNPNPNTWLCSEQYCPYWGMCRGKG